MNSYSFYGDLQPHKGEDALPICIEQPNDEIQFAVAVLDGLGGSGCQKYTVNNKERTGASHSSEMVRETISILLSSNRHWSKSLSEIKNNLHEEIFIGLSCMDGILSNTSKSDNRLKTKLIKKFPTTLALAYLTTNNNLRFFWAGNSRIYHFDLKNKKLNFVSIDDAREVENNFNNEITMDYMLSHRDNPMSNCINFTTDFFINAIEYNDFSSGDLIIVATDGIYGCFRNHNEFEEFVISNYSNSIFNLDVLENYVRKNHDDDYSFSAFTLNKEESSNTKVEKEEKKEEENESNATKKTTIILFFVALVLIASININSYYLTQILGAIKGFQPNVVESEEVGEVDLKSSYPYPPYL